MTATVAQVNINADKWTDFISKFNTSANVLSSLAVTLDANNTGSFTVNGNITITNTGSFKVVTANTINAPVANVISFTANTASINGLTVNTSTFNVINSTQANVSTVNANNVSVTGNTALNLLTANAVAVANALIANSVFINHHVASSVSDLSQHLRIANNVGFSYTANSFNAVAVGKFDVVVDGIVAARFTSNTSPQFVVPLAVTQGGTGANTIGGVRTAIGLGDVDNTSDVNKPVSTATQNALNSKQNNLESVKLTRLGRNGVENAAALYYYTTANTDISAYGMAVGRDATSNGTGYIINTGTGTFVIQNYDGIINFATNQTVRINNQIVGNNAFRNITVSNSAPSGGASGDIWLVI